MRWSTDTWLQTRQRLGRERDRAGILAYQIESGYTPFDWQIRGHLHDVANPALRTQKLEMCGLGAGKTDFGVRETQGLAMANPGMRVLITAPSFELLKHEIVERWRAANDDMSRARLPLSKRFHKTDMMDEWWCGLKVFFRSLERLQLQRGRQYAVWWGDEMETILDPQLAWNVLSGRVRQKDAPMRQAFATGTPRGRRGLVELFTNARMRARAAEGKLVDGVDCIRQKVRGREVWVPRSDVLGMWWTQRATSHDNPTLGDDYFAALAGMSERRYREEVLAEILEPEAAVWPEVDARKHGIDWPRPWVRQGDKIVANPKLDRQLEWDISYDAGDSFPHALFWQRRRDGTCIIVDEYCEDAKPLSYVHDSILWRAKAMGRQPSNGIGDRAVPEELGWMMDQWPGAEIRKMVRRVEQDVLTGIELVRDRLSPFRGEPKILVANHLIENPGKRGIWACLKGYRHAQRSDGSLDVRPLKDGKYDNGADALRMHQVALFGEGAGPRTYTTGRRW